MTAALGLSAKQRSFIAEADGPYSLITAVGSIRSGKTHATIHGFMIWSQLKEQDNRTPHDYAIIGRSVASIERNVMRPLLQFCTLFGFEVHRNHGFNTIQVGRIKYWVIGASDIRAADRIQGATFGGALIDESALLTQDFVMQALGRCSVENAKTWHTLNPENPAHWFKKEIVDQPERYNAKLYTFQLDDNPSLSDEAKQRFRRQYGGHFYQRFIEGKWAAPHGAIYPTMAPSPRPTGQESLQTVFSMDYAAAGVWAVIKWQRFLKKRWWATDEIYRDYRKEPPLSDEEMVEHLVSFINDEPYIAVYIDPATHTRWKRKARGAGIKIRHPRVGRLEGIRATDSYLRNGTINIDPNCPNLLDEGASYVWDEKALQRGDEEPLKENDHAMDAMRYFVTGHIYQPNRIVDKPVGW